MEASSASPSDNGVSSCALSLARPVLATSVRAFVLDAFTGPGKPGARLAMAALTTSSASTFSHDDCLDVSPSSSTAPSLLRHHLGTPSCTRGLCGYLNFGILDYYVDHGYPTHGIFDYGYSPLALGLPRHRQKGLSSA